MLEQIDSERLTIHAVWMPVLGADNAEAAIKAEPLLSDARVVHYWDGDQALGKLYGKALTLPRGRQLAWDIYFVYAPGVEWGEELPQPTDWMHQLGDDPRRLDGDKLRDSVRALLPDRAAETRANP